MFSDARSGQIVDDRIRPALESGSAVGSSKPVLLIIDEIDGATGAGDNVSILLSLSSAYLFIFSQSSSFIHKLVQLTYDKPRKKRERSTHFSTIIRIYNYFDV